MKKLISSLAVAAFMLFSSTSFASTIYGDSSGVFTNPIKQSKKTWYSGVGTRDFRFGKGPYGNYSKSGLWYTGHEFHVDDTADKFKIGTLSFFNGISYVGTSVDGVDLELDIEFNNLTDQSITFDLGLDQALNPAGDSLYLPTPFTSDQVFNINGSEFTFMAVFGEFDDNGLFTAIEHIEVGELKFDSVALYGMFTPVPIPAAFWLFGSALATLMVTRRGQKAA